MLLGVHGAIRAGAIEREHDIIRVEIRAVVEFHTVLQGEGVDEAVTGHIPAFGELGLDRTIIVDPGQSLEQVGVDDFIDRRSRAGRRVEMRRLEGEADRKRVFLLGLRSRCRQESQTRGDRNRGGNAHRLHIGRSLE